MKIEIVGDWLIAHHPEHGGIDVAKLIPNPLAKSPAWEKLIHQMAAGPRLAEAAARVLDAFNERVLTVPPEAGADVLAEAIEATEALRYALAAATPPPADPVTS